MSSLSLTADTPRESARSRTDAGLGMALFIGSWSMAFAALFLSFLILRNREPVWPPVGAVLPSLPLASLATLALLASSFTVRLAVRRGARGDRGLLGGWLATCALGLVFAALQTWLWRDLWAAGALPDSGLYAGLFYLLTWFHAAHVAVGLVLLGLVALGIRAGRIGPARISPATSVATFWHFVDAIWLVMFLGFFVF